MTRRRRVKKRHLINAGKKERKRDTEEQTDHQKLVDIAKEWLSKKCAVVITEMKAGFGEVPDAIGWNWSMPIVIECKSSIADFNSDSNKPHRRNPESGLGLFRYYMAYAGVIRTNLLPPGWGLIEVSEWQKGKRKGQPRVSIVRQCDTQYFLKRNERKEVQILLSAIRRIAKSAGKDLTAVSARAYVHDTKACAQISLCTKLKRDY